jgi:hypothetical protein
MFPSFLSFIVTEGLHFHWQTASVTLGEDDLDNLCPVMLHMWVTGIDRTLELVRPRVH